MTSGSLSSPIVPALDEATSQLVRLAGAIAAGTEAQMRGAVVASVPIVDPVWVEELILQSYLFAGFPRALNAMREWRRVSGRTAPAGDPGTDAEQRAAEWRREGERTCATVYDGMYEQLRVNIAALHPALDSWMVVEGYGKILSRPGLDLVRRELCIVAACAAAKQDRQLQSHLHGALNVGATAEQVAGALAALAGQLSAAELKRALAMLARVAAR